MATTCTRCKGEGFLNLDQMPFAITSSDRGRILLWIATHHEHDVAICDCCGDGFRWHDVPGEHYNSEDRAGPGGPYAYNGGLCECN